MVLEQVLTIKKIIKKPEYSLYIGVVFTLIAFFTSYLLFNQIPSFIGISTILFTVIITIPLVAKLFKYEAKIIKIKRKFFRKHKIIIDFFIYFFIGLFVTFFVLALAFPDKVFSESQLYGKPTIIQETIRARYKDLPPPPPVPEGVEISHIFKNNLYVLLISFILSLFYGSGALFLIVLNASIFASALAQAIRVYVPLGLGFLPTYSFIACNLGIMFFHMVPEVVGYLFAAIAGGVLSKAVLKEKFFSRGFFRVVGDSVVLIVMAVAAILIASVIEIKVSKQLFNLGVCFTNYLLVLLILILVITALVMFEILRKRKWK